MKDKRTAENLRKDPAKHAAYLERKRRERKRQQFLRGYGTTRKRAWRAANPIEAQRLRKAHHAVESAIAKGELYRPDNCSKCGAECVPDAHHESYEPENWLKVVWLCDGCHQSVHANPSPITL